MAGHAQSQTSNQGAIPIVNAINPSIKDPQPESPPASQNFVRLFTLKFENPNLGFSVVENENGNGLKICNVTEKMKNVGLKENYTIMELNGRDMKMATLADWRNTIQRCRLPVRVRFKSLYLSVEEENKYRQDLKETERKLRLAPPPKPKPQPDPTCLFCGVSLFLVLFAFLVYVSLMGMPFTLMPSGQEDSKDVFTWISKMLGRASESSRPEPIHKTVFVDLADVYLGKKVTFKPGKIRKVCPHCSGTGAHHGEEEHMHICDSCEGSGVVLEKRELFGGLHMSSEAVCPKCGGLGHTISKKCNHCNGKGNIIKDEKLTVKLKKGIAEGTQVTLPGQGHQVLGYPAGDLVIEIFSKPHKVFTRDGLDLLVQLSISLSEAFKGFEKTIVHLDGRKIPISSTEVVNEKTSFRIRNEGLHTETQAGSLYIRFKIMFPRNISRVEIRRLKKMLRENVGRPPIHNYRKGKSEL